MPSVSLRVLIFLTAFLALVFPRVAYARVSRLEDFTASPPLHIKNSVMQTPSGLTPQQIKAVYHLPATGGKGTIAIIGAYEYPNLENDLNVFSRQFGLPACTQANGCLEIHRMASNIKTDTGWNSETALDTQWSHAIAPTAKILYVEAVSPSGANLIKAVDYARKRADVVAVSMSWGGGEFASESSYDSHFVSSTGASFFASSGDNGTGVEWPAVSKNVIGVGGTTLHLNSNGEVSSETAWTGSGGGVSSYISEPGFQISFGVLQINTKKRAVPDVAYNADPQSGFSVYHNGWMVVGGTSAGAPQWAAMKALGKNIGLSKLYADAAKAYSDYFRDIKKGSNGDCGADCTARKKYDLVTGLGSPLTVGY